MKTNELYGKEVRTMTVDELDYIDTDMALGIYAMTVDELDYIDTDMALGIYTTEIATSNDKEDLKRKKTKNNIYGEIVKAMTNGEIDWVDTPNISSEEINAKYKKYILKRRDGIRKEIKDLQEELDRIESEISIS